MDRFQIRNDPKPLYLAKTMEQLHNQAIPTKDFHLNLVKGCECYYKSGMEALREGDDEVAYISFVNYVRWARAVKECPGQTADPQSIPQTVPAHGHEETSYQRGQVLSDRLTHRYNELNGLFSRPPMKEFSKHKRFMDVNLFHGLIVSNPPSGMLIIDCRPRNEFTASQLDLSRTGQSVAVLNVPEEIILNSRISTGSIKSQLDNEGKRLWSWRWFSEYVVLIDWKSGAVHRNKAITKLKKILRLWDPTNVCKKPLYILDGGLRRYSDEYPMYVTDAEFRPKPSGWERLKREMEKKEKNALEENKTEGLHKAVKELKEIAEKLKSTTLEPRKTLHVTKTIKLKKTQGVNKIVEQPKEVSESFTQTIESKKTDELTKTIELMETEELNKINEDLKQVKRTLETKKIENLPNTIEGTATEEIQEKVEKMELTDNTIVETVTEKGNQTIKDTKEAGKQEAKMTEDSMEDTLPDQSVLDAAYKFYILTKPIDPVLQVEQIDLKQKKKQELNNTIEETVNKEQSETAGKTEDLSMEDTLPNQSELDAAYAFFMANTPIGLEEPPFKFVPTKFSMEDTLPNESGLDSSYEFVIANRPIGLEEPSSQFLPTNTLFDPELAETYEFVSRKSPMEMGNNIQSQRFDGASYQRIGECGPFAKAVETSADIQENTESSVCTSDSEWHIVDRKDELMMYLVQAESIKETPKEKESCCVQ